MSADPPRCPEPCPATWCVGHAQPTSDLPAPSSRHLSASLAVVPGWGWRSRRPITCEGEQAIGGDGQVRPHPLCSIVPLDFTLENINSKIKFLKISRGDHRAFSSKRVAPSEPGAALVVLTLYLLNIFSGAQLGGGPGIDS